MAHAWVVDPDGQAWDAGGPLSMEEVHQDFIASQPRPLADIRYESFADEAAFMDRHRELAGDWWQDCQEWFAGRQPKALIAMQEHVLPRWERLAEAASAPQEKQMGLDF